MDIAKIKPFLNKTVIWLAIRQITEHYWHTFTLMARTPTLIWDACVALTAPPQQPGLRAGEEVKAS